MAAFIARARGSNRTIASLTLAKGKSMIIMEKIRDKNTGAIRYYEHHWSIGEKMPFLSSNNNLHTVELVFATTEKESALFFRAMRKAK